MHEEKSPKIDIPYIPCYLVRVLTESGDEVTDTAKAINKKERLTKR